MTVTARCCAWCASSLDGKRSHAVYCSRTCKTKGSDRRRVEDGREKTRSRLRYPTEAERRRAGAIDYGRRNPERGREAAKRRKARLRSVAVYQFTETDWARLKARYHHCCAYCAASGVPLQRDHVIPLARGGSHGAGNILPACARCNYGKRTSLLIEWKVRLRSEGR